VSPHSESYHIKFTVGLCSCNNKLFRHLKIYSFYLCDPKNKKTCDFEAHEERSTLSNISSYFVHIAYYFSRELRITNWVLSTWKMFDFVNSLNLKLIALIFPLIEIPACNVQVTYIVFSLVIWVTIDGVFGFVNWFTDHLQVVSRNNYNIMGDFHTAYHSTLFFQSAFTSRCLVIALNNGYSCAIFSLDVSGWILTMEILLLPCSRCCPLVDTPHLNSQLPFSQRQSYVTTDG
jgi:hypothetical protein